MLRFLRSGTGHTKLIWWAVAIITIVTFVGGFIFLFGARSDAFGGRRRSDGAVGRVNGKEISTLEYQAALQEQRENYQRQFGSDPAERDQKLLEVQAWRSVVSKRLLFDQASQLGLKAHDREVLIALETSPPTQVTRLAAFQTDGKFDVQKYQQALRNPQQNWSGVEDLVREQIPVRKLQERLMASVKLTNSELAEAYHNRYDHLDGVVLAVAPPDSLKVPAPSEADLARAYQAYRGRFSSGMRVQLEVLNVPRKFSAEDVRTARETAAGLVTRARSGEDFQQLAKDYSEGPGAAAGGVIPRTLGIAELGNNIGPRVVALKPGEISEPIEEQGRVLIFKVLERPIMPGSAMPGFKLAQIIIKVRADDASMRDQFDELAKMRARALSQGLGAVAAEKGMATTKTEYYDANQQPQQLFTCPEAADWGLNAKLKQVSPVFDALDSYVIVQVAGRHEGGPATRDEVAEPLRQIATMEAKIEADKHRADAIAAEFARGQSLEAVAKSHGMSTFSVSGMTRETTDPRLGNVPEVVGAMFGAPPGKVVGPVRTLGGWYFVRVDRQSPAANAGLDSMRTKLSNEILQRRQQEFFIGYLTDLRLKSKIVDDRAIQTP